MRNGFPSSFYVSSLECKHENVPREIENSAHANLFLEGGGGLKGVL